MNRRIDDTPSKMSELLGMFYCAAITAIGTLSYLIILADSL